MWRGKKKAISLLLTVAMVLGMMPSGPAYAKGVGKVNTALADCIDQIVVTEPTADFDLPQGDTMPVRGHVTFASTSEATSSEATWASASDAERTATVSFKDAAGSPSDAVKAQDCIIDEFGDFTTMITAESGIMNQTVAMTVEIQGKSSDPLTIHIIDTPVTPVPVRDIDVFGPPAGVVGTSLSVYANVWPTNATNQDVTWKSLDETIATVAPGDTEGSAAVKLLKVGKVTIQATAQDGSEVIGQHVITITESEVEAQAVRVITNDRYGSTTLSVGEQFFGVIAEIAPTNTTNQKVTWSSENSEIATVDEFGWVDGLKAGKAKITATTANRISGSIWIKVVDGPVLVESIATVGPSFMYVDDSWEYYGAISPGNATEQGLTWTATPEGMVDIQDDARGVWIKALKTGKVTIKATAKDASHQVATQVVTILPKKAVLDKDMAVNQLSFARPKYRLLLDEWDFPMQPELNMEPIAAMNNPTQEWTSSNKNVVTVDKEGIVSIVGRGTATLSFTTGGKTAKCTIEVPKIQLTIKKDLKLQVDSDKMVTYQVQGATDEEYQGAEWKSADPTIADVQPGLDLTPGSEGTAIIYGKKIGKTNVTLTIGEKTATMAVEVTENPPLPTADEKLDDLVTDELLEALNSGNPETIKAAVKKIVEGITKVINDLNLDVRNQIMDSSVVSSLKNLELALSQSGRFETNDAYNDGVDEAVSAEGFTFTDVVGAMLNLGEEHAGPVKPVVEVKMAQNPPFIPAGAPNTFAIDISLFAQETTGANAGKNGPAITELRVPLQITMERPTALMGIADEDVVIYHCHADGSYELIKPTFNEDGTLTITVTGLSTFVFAKQPERTSNDSGNSGNSYKQPVGRWIQDATGWWYQNADKSYPANRWILLPYAGTEAWYHFNAAGYMDSGWYTDADSHVYYLNPVSDGTKGSMKTGWQLIDQKWYYFNPVSNGLKGALLVNTTTPDGYKVNAKGVWEK
ncbi:MAG: Ig-like domain-containing protein [Hungatella sp.]